MKLQPELFVVLIHILITLVYAIFILAGKSHLHKEQILLILFVPVFGLVMALVIEMMNVLREQGSLPLEMEPLWLGDDILWVTLKSFHEKGDLVPLEEALLIDNVKVRRRFMLETLYADPTKYLDVLNVAKYNDDIETSHYATTTIAEAQKKFQLSIQKLAVGVEKEPGNLELLNQYIGTIEKYLDSGLLEKHLLLNLRIVYAKELDKKLDLIGIDKSTLVSKLRNCIELEEYDSALEISHTLLAKWPLDEVSWIETIRMCVDGQETGRLQEIIAEMKTKKISWSNEGKKQVTAWLKESVQ